MDAKLMPVISTKLRQYEVMLVHLKEVRDNEYADLRIRGNDGHDYLLPVSCKVVSDMLMAGIVDIQRELEFHGMTGLDALAEEILGG